MIKKSSVILLLLASLLTISCANIQQTIYLQEVEVKGPMNLPPVRITKDKAAGDFTISPRYQVMLEAGEIGMYLKILFSDQEVITFSGRFHKYHLDSI